MYESELVEVKGAIVTTFTYTGSQKYYQGNILDSVSAAQSGLGATIDTKTGFYPNAPYVPVTTASFTNTPLVEYCITGNVNYEFSVFNIVPRDSADIMMNCKANSTSGIEKYSNNVNAHLYPNPVAGELTIVLPFVATKANVSFTDILGKEVMTNNNLSGSALSISDINLPAGVYMVKIVADGKTQIAKIVKQ